MAAVREAKSAEHNTDLVRPTLDKNITFDYSLSVSIASQSDLNILQNDDFKLCLALGMTRNGQDSFNTLWQWSDLQLMTNISWKAKFYIRYQAEGKEGNVTSWETGSWVPATLGEVLLLNSSGIFVTGTDSSDPTMLIVTNEFDPGPRFPNGINIQLGIETPGDTPDLVWSDPASMFMNMTFSYTLPEKLQWWYGSDPRAGRKIPGVFGTPTAEANYGPGGYFFWQSQYDIQKGVWNTEKGFRSEARNHADHIVGDEHATGIAPSSKA